MTVDAPNVSDTIGQGAALPPSSELSSHPNTSERVLVLEPGRAERHYWRDLWRYRELFAILAWRDVAVRYKQTVIGVAWAVDPPAPHHGGLHRRLRQARQAAERRRARPIRSWSSPACCRGSCSRAS